MSPASFRVAVVGLGFAAGHLHFPALATLPGATIVGACDVDPVRRADVARRWRIPTFGDFDAMVSSTQPDVVVVATPPHLHAEFCRRALTAGAHVICEKPFVSSVVEADQVIAEARLAGRQVGLNHEFREMPIFRSVLDAVTATGRSNVIFAQVTQMINLPPSREAGWRGAIAHRALYEAGVHLVDYLLAVFGELPVAVSATMSSGGDPAQPRDSLALVTLEFSGGRLAQLTQYRLSKGEPQYFDVRVETTRETLRASFGGRARLSAGLYRSAVPHLRLEFGVSGLAWRETPTRRIYLARNPRQPGLVATREVLEKTLGAFRDGTAPPATAMDGRTLIKVIAAGYHAASTGTRVRLDQAEDESAIESLPMGALATG